MAYFDIKRDNELIAAGTHFWCEACLYARPVEIKSPDSRYCFRCYDFLLREANQMQGKRGRPAWVPKAPTKSKSSKIVAPHVALEGARIMSTSELPKSRVDIIQPKTPKNTRGPKFRKLPTDLIIQLSGEGLGSKAIATRLKAQEIEISYKTIQRILRGERQLL